MSGAGRLIVARRDGEPRILASGLNCPMGVSLDGRGAPIVTEFERARIVDASGAVRQAGYPGYLGRLRKAGNGYAAGLPLPAGPADRIPQDGAQRSSTR